MTIVEIEDPGRLKGRDVFQSQIYAAGLDLDFRAADVCYDSSGQNACACQNDHLAQQS